MAGSWKKYFRSSNTQLSPIGSTTGKAVDPAFRNYRTNLPDVYIGQPNRIDRYNQWEQLDMDSEVNAALDILAEFCTQSNDDNNTPFEINFKNKPTDNEVKIIKEQLQQWVELNQFNKRIFKMFRNTLKYGDQVFIRDPENFKLLWTAMDKITKVIVNEAEGKKPEQYVVKDLQPNFQNLTVTAITTNDAYLNSPQLGGSAGAAYMQPNSPYSTGSRFSHAQNEGVINAEHVVHLSLSEGLDLYWPFGSSVLDQVFKVYKQKELLEDAIIIYRIQRAPERRVFYIDVGNMPSHMAMAFVERVKNEIHQRRIPSSTGSNQNMMDASYNSISTQEDYFFPQCLDLETKIPLLDGRTLTLNEIIDEYQEGKRNWVYGLSNITHDLEPAEIKWAGITRKNAQVLKITLDNGKEIVATPDHLFITREGREGKEIEAQKLEIDQHLMSFEGDFRISKIEWLDNRIDTGDITIESESDSHWFALEAGIYVHNSAEGRGSKVEVLPGGCLAMDTKVPLLDGRELTLTELTAEYKEGKKNWTYSANPETGEIVPGIISWAGVTQESAKVMKLTLDNGESLVVTPDHKFPIIGKGKVRADELVIGESFIPHNTRLTQMDPKYPSTYRQVYQPHTKEWEFTHRMVGNFMKNKEMHNEMLHDTRFEHHKKTVIHYDDLNRYNNNPENLFWMGWRDHTVYHHMLASMNKIKFEKMKVEDPAAYKAYQDKTSEHFKQWHASMTDDERASYQLTRLEGQLAYYQNRTEEQKARDHKVRCENFAKGNEKVQDLLQNDLKWRDKFTTAQKEGWAEFKQTDAYVARNAKIGAKSKVINNDPVLRARIKEEQSLKFDKRIMDYVQSLCKDKTSFELTRDDITAALNANDELRELFISQNSNGSKPNFDVNAGFKEHQLATMAKQFGYKNWRHFRKEAELYNHKLVAVEYIAEPIEVGTLTIDVDEKYHNYHNFALCAGLYTINSNIGEITDLRYFTNKLFRGLRIPSSYLPTTLEDGSQSYNDGKVGIAMIQEWRFNQYCKRLQTLVVENLDKEFKIYMRWRGVNIDSQLFDLKFTEPQNFASYRQAEIDQVRINTFSSLEQIPYMSKRFMLKRFLGLTELEMSENEILWKEEQDDVENTSAEQSSLRGIGVTPGGIESDLNTLGDFGGLGNENELGGEELGLGEIPSAPEPSSAGIGAPEV